MTTKFKASEITLLKNCTNEKHFFKKYCFLKNHVLQASWTFAVFCGFCLFVYLCCSVLFSENKVYFNNQ